MGYGNWLTSMELNTFPLYASANSAAREGVLNLSKTIDRFGAESLTVVMNNSNREGESQCIVPNHPQQGDAVTSWGNESQKV